MQKSIILVAKKQKRFKMFKFNVFFRFVFFKHQLMVSFDEQPQAVLCASLMRTITGDWN